MNVSIKPAQFLRGKIHLPPSKSYSIRAFIIAACGGLSHIFHPSDCDDVKVAMRVARALGSSIKSIGENAFEVRALSRPLKLLRINVGESGTVLRFLLPLLSLAGQKALIVGEGTLRGRPNTPLVDALRTMGVDIEGRGPNHSVPIRIKGGRLLPGRIEIDGSLSSQFISALLIACPRLPADTQLMIKGKKVVSRTYITMTEQILKECGVKIRHRGKNQFFIPGRQVFSGLKNYDVPSDYGLAAFFMAAAAVLPAQLTLQGNLSGEFVQSDGQILGFLKKMGVGWTKTDSFIKISGPFALRGGDFSLRNCPDLVPIMAVLALFADGRTRLLDIAHARTKESDRISDLKTELIKIGAKLQESENGLTIIPQSFYKGGRALNPHHDHRLAMAFSILGLKVGVRVKDIECTSKSYPDFLRDLKKLHTGVSAY